MINYLFFTFLGIFVATAVVALLGITKRVNIDEKYLKPLFASLILEVVSAVIFLFVGANFFGNSAQDFIKGLPEELQAETDGEVTSKISFLVRQSGEQSLKIKELETLLDEKIKSLEEHKEFEELEGNVLILFARLNLDIAKSSGGFINLGWHPEEKLEVASRIHETLAALDALTSEVSSDPLEVRQALIEYQTNKQLSTTVGNFGRETLHAMISDYLRNMSRVT